MDPVVLALGVLSLFFASTQANPVGLCVPGRAAYTKDDRDCNVYYFCSGRTWSRQQCPIGKLYNPVNMRCVPAGEYICPVPATGSGTGGSTGRGCSATSCLNDGVCMPSTDGLGQCRCTSGYTGNSCETKTAGGGDSGGSSDASSDASACSATAPCHNDGRCIDGLCFCALGYTGKHCDDSATSDDVCPVPKEKECDPACENGGKCFDKDDEPTCFCADGFGGENCEIILEPCKIISCQNSGECVVEDGEGKCKCKDGFSGDRCQMKVSSACAHLECQNNAPCKMKGRTITCDCPDGFTGDKCQYVDFCPKITCLNKGECQTDGDGNAFCSCPVRYTGSFCEIELTCDGFTCHNGGTCKIKDNARTCECPDRTEGDRCEKKLTCDGVTPCFKGSTCVDSEDGFVCACPYGRTGQFCTELRPCSDNIICENGGTCEDDKDEGATCTCDAGFQGPRCETAKDDCGGCQNGGVCHLPRVFASSSKDRHCACPAGFSGNLCEVRSECTTPCPENAGKSGKIYHVFVYPDIVNKEYVYLCAEGRLTHLHYCEEGTWFDPFALTCHTKDSLSHAIEVAGRALYPDSIPT